MALAAPPYSDALKAQNPPRRRQLKSGKEKTGGRYANVSLVQDIRRLFDQPVHKINLKWSRSQAPA